MEYNKNYEPIKESRGWYFVEYFPPRSGTRFAVLQLVILESASQEKIASAMEQELKNFLKRYPIPIMVSSFDNKGSLYNLGKARTSNHLIGFVSDDNQIRLHWRLLKDEEIPDVALDKEYMDRLYSGLIYKTSAELDVERRKKRRQLKTGWVIFFIWLVVIPAIIAILEYYSNLLSLIVLIYSLYQAVKKGLELTGKWPKSKKAKEKEREEQLKNHYYYHCQMNPEGFRKLMLENLDKKSENEIAKEAELLKNNKIQSKL
jgi:uncharacterized protein YeaC (DUF1315 family)